MTPRPNGAAVGAPHLTSMRLAVAIVTDEAGFASLRPAWNRLAHVTEPQSVFLRHEYFDAAWQWRRFDSSLRLVCFYDADVLIGVAPLLMRRRRHRGLRVRQLEFLTVPDTQECGLIVAPEHRDAVINALVEHLIKSPQVWDIVTLSKLPESWLQHARLFDELRRNGVRVTGEVTDVCPCVKLSGDWKSYYGGRTRRLKKGNNLIANKLQARFAAVEVTRAAQDSPAPIAEQALTEFLQLAAMSWKAELDTAAVRPGPLDFLKRLTDHAARLGWLSVWFLRLDGAVAAGEYQLSYGGRVAALRADVSRHFADTSAGTYLNWQILQRLFTAEAALYNMGPGASSYKLRWSNHQENLVTITGYRRSLAGIWSWWIDRRLKPFVAKLRRYAARGGEESHDAD